MSGSKVSSCIAHRQLDGPSRLVSRVLSFVLVAASLTAQPAPRVPGEAWQRFVDVREAGFDPERLEAAHRRWTELPSSAFLVVADGAVVAAWGDVQRRFMCHSVRKSLLSALYGIYHDRGELELNKTLQDLGLDDAPDPLLERERQARILDLLKARSGVFHPAAYAGRTDSRPRGSEAPGRFFAYNNWDFNTLAAILKQETGADVFDAFDRHFGQPLGMQDWRLSDGYYHYERDKSRFPAYPFRMSARDLARFGLLFARDGDWGGRRVLSRNWVRRSTAEYSIDDDAFGYGFMWWVLRGPRFAPHGGYCALGVGNQMVAVLPELDVVVVNRADTYDREHTPTDALLDLVAEVLQARVGAPVPEPELLQMSDEPRHYETNVEPARLSAFAGTFAYPAPPLGLPARAQIRCEVDAGHLLVDLPFAGTFRVYLQPDGRLVMEDSRYVLSALRDGDGRVLGFAMARDVLRGAVHAAARGEAERARALLAELGEDAAFERALGAALLAAIDDSGERPARDELLARQRGRLGAFADPLARELIATGHAAAAGAIFTWLTEQLPQASGAWAGLGFAHERAGQTAAARRAYERALELVPEHPEARAGLQRLR